MSDLPKKSRPEFIYLASQSPRRAQLLDQLGVQHQPLIADESENAEALEDLSEGEGPRRYVARVTRAKLQAARKRLKQRGLPQAPVLVADTAVALGKRIYGKPSTAEEATAILKDLSGRSHRVITGVALARGNTVLHALQVSIVRFAPLDDTWIAEYVATEEPFGKAGAYGIQGRMAGWIEHIEGSYSGIMGLPLFETTQLLRQARVLR